MTRISISIFVISVIFPSVLANSFQIAQNVSKRPSDCWIASKGTCVKCSGDNWGGWCDGRECFVNERACCLVAPQVKCELDGIFEEDCSDGFAVSKDRVSSNDECAELCRAAVSSGDRTKFDEVCRFERIRYPKWEDKVEILGSCFSNWIFGYSDEALHGGGGIAEVGEVVEDVKTASACQQRCQENASCAVFTWRALGNEGTSSQKKYRCLLKSLEVVSNALASTPSSGVNVKWCSPSTASLCSQSSDRCLKCPHTVCVHQSTRHVSGPTFCGNEDFDACRAADITTTSTSSRQTTVRPVPPTQPNPTTPVPEVETTTSGIPSTLRPTRPTSISTSEPTDNLEGLVVNGNFHIPVVTHGFRHVPIVGVEGWMSHDPRRIVTLWASGYEDVVSPSGGQFGILYGGSGIFQDIELPVAATYKWSFDHRGEDGDSTAFEIEDGEGNVLVRQLTRSVLPPRWWHYEGTVVVHGPTAVKLLLVPKSSGKQIGNFITGVRLEFVDPPLEITTESPTSSEGSVSEDIGESLIINGNFHDPEVFSGFRVITLNQVPGWLGEERNRYVTLWGSGYEGIPSPTGRQFAVTSYTASSTGQSPFFQDLNISKPGVYFWAFQHAAFMGVDTLRFEVVDESGRILDTYVAETTPTSSWSPHQGEVTVEQPGRIRLRFCPHTTSRGYGNFLTGVEFRFVKPLNFVPVETTTMQSTAVRQGTPSSCTTKSLLVNGNFELPAINSQNSSVTGWTYSVHGDAVLLNTQNDQGMSSFEGKHFVQLRHGSIHQDIVVVEKGTFRWSFSHRSMGGVGVLSLDIGTPNDRLESHMVATGSHWKTYEGKTRIEHEGVVRISLRAVVADIQNANFVDGVSFSRTSCEKVGPDEVKEKERETEERRSNRHSLYQVTRSS